MATPHIAQRGPYVLDEKPGKKAWCSCGFSETQPYCDGSHKNTDFKPVYYEVKTAGEVAWCGCKYSKTKPMCDGSHQNLPE